MRGGTTYFWKQETFKGGVYMDYGIVVALKAVIINQGKILILKRSDTDEVGAKQWETPGGKIEFGEGLETALFREVKEETGINVYVERLLYAVTFLAHPDRQIVLLSYLCRSNQSDVLLSSEHSDYLWANQAELHEFLPQAIIDDFEKHGVFSLEE